MNKSLQGIRPDDLEQVNDLETYKVYYRAMFDQMDARDVVINNRITELKQQIKQLEDEKLSLLWESTVL